MTLTNEENAILNISLENSAEFIYSKKSHFQLFQKNKYDQLFYGNDIGHEGYNIIVYQNLLVFSFITQNIPQGSRILVIGAGDDLIFNHFKFRYEFWKLEVPVELIHDHETIDEKKNNVITDNKGNLRSKLPQDYFDFIFSISGFEEIPSDKTTYRKILDNIIYMMKPGGYSMHCFSASIIKDDHFFYHNLLNYFNNNVSPLFYNVIRSVNIPEFKEVIADPDLHFKYDIFKSASEFNYGNILPTSSYNFIWKKNHVELTQFTETKTHKYFENNSAYIFHHLMKCGGTSLTVALDEWFNLKLDHIKTENRIIGLNEYLNYKYNLENLSPEDCIVSHFQSESYFLHQRYPEALEKRNKFKIFTFVREPLSIVTSLYYYVRKAGGLQNISLLQSIKYSRKNFLASLFPCDESNYKEILDRYFFIGIVEKMQESMDKLAMILNKKRIVVPLANTTEKDSQLKELTPEFISEFRKNNKLDYLIYEYCLEKFSKY